MGTHTHTDVLGDELEEALGLLLRLQGADAVHAGAELERLGHRLLDAVVREQSTNYYLLLGVKESVTRAGDAHQPTLELCSS